MRRFGLVSAIFLVGAMVAGLALAQSSTSVTGKLTLSETGIAVDAGARVAVELRVANTGLTDASVELGLTPRSGWFASLALDAFALRAGESKALQIQIMAPAPGEGRQVADFEVTATLRDDLGRTGTVRATFSATRVDPPPNRLPYILGGVLTVLVLLAVGVWWELRRRRLIREEAQRQLEERERLAQERERLAQEEEDRRTKAELERQKQIRLVREETERIARQRAQQEEEARQAREAYLDRETGILIRCMDGPRALDRSRRDSIFCLAVENVSNRPRVAIVGTDRPIPGWRAGFSLNEIPLDAGQEVTLSFYVMPDDSVDDGASVDITVSARPEEATELAERLVLHVTTLKPEKASDTAAQTDQ